MRTVKSSTKVRKPVWLLPFADMSTLLLTFFVLLFSMSSMDSRVVARISAADSSMGFSLQVGTPAPMKRAKQFEKALKEKGDSRHNLQEIFILLFPDPVMPLDLPKSETEKTIQLVETNEGLVIVLSGDVLFDEGLYELNDRAKSLLGSLTPVMQHADLDVNISGFADSGEKLARNGGKPDKHSPVSLDELSALRAVAVLEYFLRASVPPGRFSISGYGADHPRFSGSGDRAHNRRVEILFKVKKPLGSYA